jgi:hypothetical protein
LKQLIDSPTATMLTMFSGTKIAALPPGVNTSSPQLRARGTSTSKVPTIESTQTADHREERRRVHHEADIVIVGAGIVGCAAAVAFGKQGRSVILLEKSLKEPDRIVGELLQPGGVNALEKLGMRGTSGSMTLGTYGADKTQIASTTSTRSPATATRSSTARITFTSPTPRTSSHPRPRKRQKDGRSTTAASSRNCAQRPAQQPTSQSSKLQSPPS